MEAETRLAKAKSRPLREVTEEEHLDHLRSLIDDDILVSIDRKQTCTTRNGRMHNASWQMIDRLLGDRETATGDIIKLEKEILELKKKLAKVKKALK